MEPLFSPAWFAAGVVTDSIAADFAQQAAAAPHHCPRHWRWQAFRDWSEERDPLTADECRAAYELGVREAAEDSNLGVAILCHVLLQRHCPAEVRAAAINSPFPAVQKAACRGEKPTSSGGM
ncbi:MAG: hypothetical protein RMJ56_01665 [Gemmataceae bacterium]|nr:hypothetical protein [Gemmata sp.]MDW8196290.1 hypothetical protein [Gemmataceae bacterium]